MQTGFLGGFFHVCFASFFGLLLAGAALAGLPMGADSADSPTSDDGPQPDRALDLQQVALLRAP